MTKQNSRFMRWTSRVVMLTMLTMGLPLQPAFANIVETDQAISHELAAQDRKDVLAQLQQQGVSPGDAKARVSALTDDEAHAIAGKLDQLPAGGDVLGALLFVFIVLLVTDILGFTSVFPFTHPINKR
jgi:Family of unknown function (DUF6627)